MNIATNATTKVHMMIKNVSPIFLNKEWKNDGFCSGSTTTFSSISATELSTTLLVFSLAVMSCVSTLSLIIEFSRSLYRSISLFFTPSSSMYSLMTVESIMLVKLSFTTEIVSNETNLTVSIFSMYNVSICDDLENCLWVVHPTSRKRKSNINAR